MNKEKAFLKDLQKDMLAQETDGQASPRYWAIMDYRWVSAPDDDAERVSLFSPNSYEIEPIVEYLEHLKEEMLDDLNISQGDLVALKEHLYFGEYDEILDWVHEHHDSEYILIYEREESFIVPNTFFLTKREAKEHLKNNSHHYTDKAHTYAMTAWRSGQVRELYRILETIDWDSVDFSKAKTN